MPLFNFTSGNPSNLTANANASMSDIQGSLTDLRTFVNGNLDETNVPNLAAAFTTYKTITMAGGGSSFGAGTFLLPGPLGQTVGVQAPGVIGTAQHAFYLDPADWAANARTTKLRVQASVVTNAVAPTTTHTFGLWAVATWGGTSGNSPSIASIGTAVTGSAIAIAAPPAAGPTPATGADFNFPAAGFYVLAVVVTGALATGSAAVVHSKLQVRQV